jgi:zinc transporter ZupT
MLGFVETFGATVASFLVPSAVGLSIVWVAARYLRPRYLAAFGLGLYLWFFSDTIGDANLLGANEGFTGGVFHVALWVAFAAGLLFMLTADRDVFSPGGEGSRLGFGIPLLVALAVGIHGFGEGAAIGATAVSTPGGDLVAAFGGVTAGAAFVLHKALEPMMVGVAYWIYARDHARDPGGRLRDMVILALVFTLPGIIGGGSAYYIVQAFPDADFTYVFALGLGTSIYAALRLARPLFDGPVGDRYEALRVGGMLMLGFTCLYLAALLHS